MIFRTKLTLCLGMALASLGATAKAASDWQVIKVGKWDYLTVDNIAKFYGFPSEVAPVGKTIRLENGRNQLEVTLDSREAMVNGVRNWLSFPVMAHTDGKFLVSRIDLAKTIEPQLRPQMIANMGPVQTVVLDPGHGGHDKGAGSALGLEKNYTLDVAKQLRPLLQAKGFRVIMTRETDLFLPLEVRARIANATKNSIFVSLHFNATDFNRAAAGFEVYSLTPRGAPSTYDDHLAPRFINMQAGSPVDAQSFGLCAAVQHSMLGHVPQFDRGIKRARFAVLRLTKIPAILVEGGFLSEIGESRLIASPVWRRKLAESIGSGIESYRDLAEKKQRPKLLADYRRPLGGELIARDPTNPLPSNADPSVPIVPASNLTAPPAHLRSGSASFVPDIASAGPVASASDSPALPPLDAIERSTPEVDPAPASVADDESRPPPAAAEPPVTVTFPASEERSQVATPPRGPLVVRQYWVLRFDPPPKFRE